jgi:lipocalin-like protein
MKLTDPWIMHEFRLTRPPAAPRGLGVRPSGKDRGSSRKQGRGSFRLMLVLALAFSRAEALADDAATPELAFPKDEGPHPQSGIEMWSLHGYFEGKDGARYSIAGLLFEGRWLVISGQVVTVVLAVDGKAGVLSGQQIFLPLSQVVEHTPGGERFGKSYYRRSERSLVDVGMRTSELSFGLRARGGSAPLPLCGTGESRWGEHRMGGYAITRSAALGRLEHRGKSTPVRGIVRLDHLWGDHISKGYDLMAISLDDGRELTVLSVHPDAVNGKTDGTCAVMIDVDGENRVLENSSVKTVRSWISSRTGARYPVEMRLESTSPPAQVHLRASSDDQEVEIGGIAAYHGTCKVDGSLDGRAVSGKCFFILLPSQDSVIVASP